VTAASGVLVVAKRAGMTSFDVVAAVRRALRVRRAGHAGTLDPDAVGVLPILLGEATKLMAYLADQDKEYRVTVRFGVTTDTLDIGGRVIDTRPVPRLTRDDIERATRPFVGAIRQIAPMYSARHHQGRRLYELAREGREVPREPRDVVVQSILVGDVADERATLMVVCGKGTYVRVLVADLGAALGPGACVERLERTRVGPFGIGDAVDWNEIPTSPPESLWARVRPPQAALVAWPAVTLDPADERRFISGQSVAAPAANPASGLVRVETAEGRLLGVGEVISGGVRVRPVRILHVDRPRTRILPA
jgi:tRNA pseudouridine55 synthase